jgi:hypothetical protein
VLGLGFLLWQLLLFGSGARGSDGYTYYNAWEILKTHVPDYLRPPVYSIIVGICKELFGFVGSMIALSIIQWCAYIASLQLVWRINCWIGVARKINCISILLYLLIPGLWVHNDIVMAESLSASCVVLFVWLSGRYIQTYKKRYLSASGFLVATMIMIKPMFILLIPVAGLFWLFACWKRKRHYIIAAVAILATIALTETYKWCVHRIWRIDTITIATIWNDYYCLRGEGLITPEDFKDPDVRAKFIEFYDANPSGWPKSQPYWRETWELGYQNVEPVIKEVKSNHRAEYIASFGHRFIRSLTWCQFYDPYEDLGEAAYDEIFEGWIGLTKNQPEGFIYPLFPYITFPIYFGWIIWLCFTVMWLYRWIKSKVLPLIPALISVMMLTAYISVIIGSPDIWGRIMSPFDMMFPVMLASLFTAVAAQIRHRIAQ